VVTARRKSDSLRRKELKVYTQGSGRYVVQSGVGSLDPEVCLVSVGAAHLPDKRRAAVPGDLFAVVHSHVRAVQAAAADVYDTTEA
jgi:hypothetical protein